MLNLPWGGVIAVTKSLLYLYSTHIMSVPTQSLTSASNLWYLLYIFVQSWLAGGKGLISKGNILSRLCPSLTRYLVIYLCPQQLFIWDGGC